MSHSPRVDGGIFDTVLLTSCLHRFPFPTNCYSVCISSVERLLLRRRPYAVIWRISQVIIKTLNGLSMRSFSHIRQKVGKIIPPFAYGDATSSISPELRVLLTGTPLLHSDPHFIGRLDCAVRGSTVSGIELFSPLDRQTSAGISLASPKTLSRRCGLGSADANAFPHRVAMPIVSRIGDYSQPAEHTISQINTSAHVPITRTPYCRDVHPRYGALSQQPKSQGKLPRLSDIRLAAR